MKISLAALGFLFSISAVAQETSDSTVPLDPISQSINSVSRNVDLLLEIFKRDAARVEELERRIGVLENELDEIESAAEREGIPKNAVLAIAAPRCPPGWEVMNEAVGRFIVGAGGVPGRTLRRVFETGGQERVVLAKDELPNVQLDVYYLNGPPTLSLNTADQPGHQILNRGSSNAALTNELVTEPLGLGRPHENMPPFLALTFCTQSR